MSASAHAIASIRAKPESIAVWTLRTVLALIFLTVGGCQLFGAQQMVQVFDQIGFGQWLRYVTGALELSGALLLLIPSVSAIGSFVLIGITLGAALAHTMELVSGNPLLVVILLVVSEISFVQTQIA